MRGVKYNVVLDEKYKFEGLTMNQLIENLNNTFEKDYNGLMTVSRNKIYNLINRPKLASKNLKKLIKIEYHNNN